MGRAGLACGVVSSCAVALLACGGDDGGSQLATASNAAATSTTSGSSAGGSGGTGSTSSSPTSTSSGGGFNPAGSGGGGGGRECDNMLVGVIRDFNQSNPDFEGELGVDPGIVASDLGADDKPVYAGPTPTTSGQAAFDQWYRDVPGVNQTIPLSVPLTELSPGIFTFDDSAFFPIDDQGFGNEGHPHNYHFTYEIHAEFVYEGGEVFTFTGDDDLFTFINGKLAIDLGGVHGPLSASIDLDANAQELGIEIGNTYPLSFFFAERHTVESNFRIDTTISCFTEVPTPD